MPDSTQQQQLTTSPTPITQTEQSACVRHTDISKSSTPSIQQVHTGEPRGSIHLPPAQSTQPPTRNYYLVAATIPANNTTEERERREDEKAAQIPF